MNPFWSALGGLGTAFGLGQRQGKSAELDRRFTESGAQFKGIYIPWDKSFRQEKYCGRAERVDGPVKLLPGGQEK